MVSAAAHEGGLLQNLFLTDDEEFLGVGIMACQLFKVAARRVWRRACVFCGTACVVVRAWMPARGRRRVPRRTGSGGA